MNTVVLVDRRHRYFPIKANWVGLTLSTTIQEHINVEIDDEETKVYLN
jgi:pyrimidine operon attenuation protein/uracil phosphoribosyltransferase